MGGGTSTPADNISVKMPSATREPSTKKSSSSKTADDAKTHKLSLKGSSKLVTEFFEYSINTILFQRGVYPAEDFTAYAWTEIDGSG